MADASRRIGRLAVGCMGLELRRGIWAENINVGFMRIQFASGVPRGIDMAQGERRG